MCTTHTRQCPCVYPHTPPACVHVTGKFAEEAKSVGRTTLKRVVKCHYNYKYKFLRPTNKQVTSCSPSQLSHAQPRPSRPTLNPTHSPTANPHAQVVERYIYMLKFHKQGPSLATGYAAAAQGAMAAAAPALATTALG